VAQFLNADAGNMPDQGQASGRKIVRHSVMDGVEDLIRDSKGKCAENVL
jgi:hypothetical protein